MHDLTKEKLTPARSAHFRRLRILGQTTGWIVFFIAVYLSGRLGVEMARDRLPDVDKEAPETLSDASLTVGKSDDPIYLARSHELPDPPRADHRQSHRLGNPPFARLRRDENDPRRSRRRRSESILRRDCRGRLLDSLHPTSRPELV